MRRALAVLAIIASLGALVAVAGWLARFDRADVIAAPGAVYELPAGAGALRVVADLRDAGLVRDDLRWRWWVQLRQPGGCLQAGRHELPDTATPAALFEHFCQPTRRVGVRVTIPEGRSIFAVAETLAEAGFGDADAILTRLRDDELARDHGLPGTSFEGYLFPDTYELDPEQPLETAIGRMVRRGNEVRAALWREHEAQREALQVEHALDDDDLVTIASIVEREAVVADERPRIARVIYNRLGRGMRLQMDPTCVYHEDHWREEPTRARCRDSSSTYSTYVIDGLPPTPIASPGASSLAAALTPSDEPDLLYFVALGDGSGRHAFANTLEEHNANVRQYLQRSGR